MNHAHRMFALSVALLALPAIAIAGASADCDEPQTQFEINQCAQEEYERSDKALNLAYQEYRAGLPDFQKALLKKAQLSWIRFRDDACEFEASAVEGGSMQPMVYSQCRSDYTLRRLERIEALSACKLMPNPGKECAG